MDTTPLGFLRIPAAIALARLTVFGASAVSLRQEDIARLASLEAAIAVRKFRLQLPPSLAKPSNPGVRVSLPAAANDGRDLQIELDQLRRRQAEQTDQTNSISLEVNAHLKSGRLVARSWRHDNGDISEVLPAAFWQSDAAPTAFRGERWFVPLVPNGTILGHEATAILRRSDVEACYAGESAEVHSDRRIDDESKRDLSLRRIGDTTKTRSDTESRALARSPDMGPAILALMQKLEEEKKWTADMRATERNKLITDAYTAKGRTPPSISTIKEALHGTKYLKEARRRAVRKSTGQ